MGKKFERIRRESHLTTEEAARDEEVRRLVKQEFPPARHAPQEGPFSDALRQALRDNETPIATIAQRVGVSPSVIDRFLSGERDLRLSVAERLAGVLGMTIHSH